VERPSVDRSVELRSGRNLLRRPFIHASLQPDCAFGIITVRDDVDFWALRKKLLFVTKDNATELMAPLLHPILVQVLIDVVRLRHVDGAIEDHFRPTRFHPHSLQGDILTVSRAEMAHPGIHIIWPKTCWRIYLVVPILVPIG